MPSSSKTAEIDFENTDHLMDTSVSDAKWLLGSVATLCLFVLVVGLFASTLAV